MFFSFRLIIILKIWNNLVNGFFTTLIRTFVVYTFCWVNHTYNFKFQCLQKEIKIQKTCIINVSNIYKLSTKGSVTLFELSLANIKRHLMSR